MKAECRWRLPLVFFFGLAFVLLVNGAVPFVLTPTLGQAVWSTGFSQSFINDSLFSLYARNFGAPEPAPMAFGLAGAWPAGVFMWLGLHAADAYALMIALWLSVAFLSAYQLGRFVEASPGMAVVGAVAWGTMPVVWGHADYSMLSLGISLLPFYFFVGLNLFLPTSKPNIWTIKKAAKWVALYFIVCLVAIFMDGYSFMMFAVGMTLLGSALAYSDVTARRWLLLFAFPVHLLCLAFVYFVFVLYLGRLTFSPDTLDFFRGWGVDVTFLLAPTTGVHWLPDQLGWSIPRSDERFFGDASVWVTSFSLPVIIGAVVTTLYAGTKKGLKTGMVLVAAFGIYMALGPALKVNSEKPNGAGLGPLMEERYGVMSTGSGYLSTYLPGFRSMRASYRWIALGVFGSWFLLVLGLSHNHDRRVIAWAVGAMGVIIALNLPDVGRGAQECAQNREMFRHIDSDLVARMTDDFVPRERVVFLPWGNDFLANYVSAKLDLIAFNIGGDKNLEMARAHWPITLSGFRMGNTDIHFAERVLLLLARNEVDAVVFPMFDMLKVAHAWPPPLEPKDKLQSIVDDLVEVGFLDIVSRTDYTVVRLKSEFLYLARQGGLEALVRSALCMPPFCLRQLTFDESSATEIGVLRDGRLISTGRAGFLKFGPYVAMNEGRYQLVVRGGGSVRDTAWADVVSEEGRRLHGRYALREDVEDDSVLVLGQVELESMVEDLEVRVYVGPEDEVFLEGCELRPSD